MRAAEQPDTHIIRPAVSPYVLLVAYLIVEQKIYLLLLKMLVQFHVLWTFLLKNKRTTVVGFF